MMLKDEGIVIVLSGVGNGERLRNRSMTDMAFTGVFGWYRCIWCIWLWIRALSCKVINCMYPSCYFIPFYVLTSCYMSGRRFFDFCSSVASLRPPMPSSEESELMDSQRLQNCVSTLPTSH
jgi:hypothetical protein